VAHAQVCHILSDIGASRQLLSSFCSASTSSIPYRHISIPALSSPLSMEIRPTTLVPARHSGDSLSSLYQCPHPWDVQLPPSSLEDNVSKAPGREHAASPDARGLCHCFISPTRVQAPGLPLGHRDARLYHCVQRADSGAAMYRCSLMYESCNMAPRQFIFQRGLHGW